MTFSPFPSLNLGPVSLGLLFVCFMNENQRREIINMGRPMLRICMRDYDKVDVVKKCRRTVVDVLWR